MVGDPGHAIEEEIKSKAVTHKALSFVVTDVIQPEYAHISPRRRR